MDMRPDTEKQHQEYSQPVKAEYEKEAGEPVAKKPLKKITDTCCAFHKDEWNYNRKPEADIELQQQAHEPQSEHISRSQYPPDLAVLRAGVLLSEGFAQ